MLYYHDMSSKPLAVALVSLGCPKNLVDSEKMLAQLAEGGCLVGSPMDDADVIVVNTCGFIAPAVDESLEVIAEALRHKLTGRARRVVVAGCLVNRQAERLYEMAPGIDAVVGVNNRDDLLAAVTGPRRVTRIDPLRAPAGGGLLADDGGRFRLTPRHTAYLRISEGCSRKCTFCTIPAIRGAFRSKLPDAILSEARELAADGAVELNIIGQDTISYGRDLPGGARRRRMRLPRLLETLDGLDGVRWIRLMYAYPKQFTDSLIDAIAACPHVVPYVDLPLQHISDAILRRMGRAVTRKSIETLLGKIRRRIAGAVIRTTFIVGFPGETDEQFDELLTFVKDFRFDALGVFEFSPEHGTVAAEMPDQVDDDVKAERYNALMLAQQELSFRANRRMVARPIEVLVDGVDGAGRCVGRYYGQAPDIDGVCYLTGPAPAGTFIAGNVSAWEGYDLIVEPAK